MHHMRANRQMKLASASHSVSASDVRGKIQRRTCFSARSFVQVDGFGCTPQTPPGRISHPRRALQAPYARKQADEARRCITFSVGK